MQLTFVTGNQQKFKEVERMLPGVSLSRKNISLMEPQGKRRDIAMHKCMQASEHVQGPLVIEDTSLGYTALGGLPGPYIKDFLETVGFEGLNKLLDGYSDKTARAYCTLAYYDPALMEAPMIFEGITAGIIVNPRGPAAFGWDPIFQPTEHASGKTFAEMSSEEKDSVSHRHRAFSQLSEYLKKNRP